MFDFTAFLNKESQMSSKYLGCFKDNSTNRDFNFISSLFSLMTAQYCFGVCSVQSFAFAGLHGGYCYCGNSYGKYGIQSSPNACSLRCGGDSTQFCGQNILNSVYNSEKFILEKF